MSTVYILSTRNIDADHGERYGICGERLDHIKAMRKAEDRRRSIAGTILMQEYLFQHGRTLQDVKVSRDGKPFVEGLHFSVAHSGSVAVLAADETEIGVDIEGIRPFPKNVLARKFTVGEQSLVLHSGNSDEMFMRIWTAKEAYLKWKGTGIRSRLDQIDTSQSCRVKDHGVDIPVCIQVKRWRDMVIAVCTKHVSEMKISFAEADFTEH